MDKNLKKLEEIFVNHDFQNNDDVDKNILVKKKESLEKYIEEDLIRKGEEYKEQMLSLLKQK